MSEPNRSINVVQAASGFCFVALGVLLLLQRAGMVEMRQIVELWPLVLVIVGSAVVWQASRGGGSPGIGGSGGGLIWIVIIGALLSHAYDRRAAAEVAGGVGGMNAFALMSGDRRTAEEGPFTGGAITTVLGGAQLDLRRATLEPGQTAVIDVFTALGGAQILVPPTWRVDVETTTVAGGVNVRRSPSARSESSGDDGDDDDGAPQTNESQPAQAPATSSPEAAIPDVLQPRLVVTGTVVMGGVTIR
jgi:hypothetical protein